MQEVNVTMSTFETEVLKSEQPVLVDFWAAWCGPCKMLMPTIEELAQSQDEIKVCKVNVDDEPQLAMKYKVMTIPTLIAFKNGEVIGKLVGVSPKDKILDLFQ
ncbi:MAG: thioredoxin [Lachnospiraceae bacterium]|nr:thioredoxin [Lachnospiraceae bacterium]